MGRLTQDEDQITAEQVFKFSNMGLDIFKAELEDFATDRNIKSPFAEDKTPSARLKISGSSDLWLLNIYNDEGGYYNALQFIQKKYNLNYREAIDYVVKKQKLNSKIQYKPKTPIIKKEGLFYEAQFIPYTKEHLDYYCIKGLTAPFLIKEMDILAIKKYAINKHVKEPKKDEIMFAYVYRDINGDIVPGLMKLLTIGPNVEKKDKWRNNIPPFSFFYTYKIKPDTKIVMVVKSNKDCSIFAKCGITAIATMSENKQNIITGLKELIPLFPSTTFVISLGSDFQGLQTSLAITKELNLPWFNIPKKLLTNDINDPFEYVKNFGFESFKQLLKNKKYL